MVKKFISLKFSNKRSLIIPESVGLSEEEIQRIISSTRHSDLVVAVESINALFLRDERSAQFNLYIKNEKETLYGQTIKLPYPKTTDFYELLSRFDTKRRRASDIEEFDIEAPDSITESEIPFVQSSDTQPPLVQSPSERTEVEDKPSEVYSSHEEKMAYDTIAEAFGNSEKMEDKTVQEEPPSEIEEEQVSELKECENCGFNNDLDAKFCSECGFSFIGKKAAETPSTETGNSMSTATKDLVANVSNTGQEKFVVDPQTNYQTSADDMQQLLKVKDGLKNRAQIEKDVALEFESKKAEAIKAADEKVEEEKRKELEALNRTFKEKQELARRDALEVLSVDEKNEVNSRVDAMKNYLKQVYETGLRSIDEGFNMKSANE